MKKLVFEIHDISPVTKEMLEDLVDKLPGNINPVLLFITYHKAKHIIDVETLDLFDKFSKKQLVMHGFSHDMMPTGFDKRQIPSSQVILGTIDAEFKSYGFDEALDAIRFGQKIFDYAGIKTKEFVAPMHRTNKSSMMAIEREFTITADNYGIIDTREGIRHNLIAMSTSMNGVSCKMDRYFSKLCEVYIKGQLAKGKDIRVLHHPVYEKGPNQHTLDILNHILDSGYKSVTHADYLGFE